MNDTSNIQRYPILHLNLKKKWFDMISQGIKTEEYREIKPFFDRIFKDGWITIKGVRYDPTDVVICFSNGYAKERKQIKFWCNGLRKGVGVETWGADPGTYYYILEIGRYEP